MSARQELIEVGRYLLNNQLAWGTSGNISQRVDEGKMLITASGTFMGDLKEEDFVLFDLEEQKNLSDRKASKETPMHTGIYRNRPDVQAVIHSSPFYTTLFSCSDEAISSELFIENMYYLEHLGYVDYFHPGTEELGQAIAEEAKKSDVILMRNHGVVVMDTSLSEALMRIETLEMTCKMIVTAKASGIKLNTLSEKTIKEFLEDSRYKPRKAR
ncbi:class II aldolase/adducin family protein [Ectobacillus funiculus]|uniref:class II aldolase/adducin family protein n=1 Tax=Ectobacillus funiculus TaxID=137993 RepID=UPI00397A66A4